MKPNEWAAHDNFSAGEFGPHPERMEPSFIARLQRARANAGVVFEITSAWRSQDESKSHWLGKAVDIRAKDSGTRWRIVDGLLEAGFVRIGVYFKTGHVHADTNTADEGFDQHVLWVGEGRA